LAAIAFSIGDPRSMKVGNASSPWRYDETRAVSLPSLRPFGFHLSDGTALKSFNLAALIRSCLGRSAIWQTRNYVFVSPLGGKERFALGAV